MKKTLFLLLTVIGYCAKSQLVKLSAPDGTIVLQVNLNTDGRLLYAVSYKNRPAILFSSLGLQLKEPAVNLQQFFLVKMDSSVHDETWKTVWGEYSSIRDHHKELRLSLKDKGNSGILLNVVFRVFNEGVGFR